MTTVDEMKEMLGGRGKTHGDFTDHARITQQLKGVIKDELENRDNRGQHALMYEQREAIDMILHKIGRIIAGDPNELDHWADIEGYARITRERIKNERD